MHNVIHFIEHATLDTLKLVPFLFLTYLVMEALEHKAGEKTHTIVKKAGRLGPIVGSLLGVLPQCGFSAAASNLFAGRVLTLGTLIAIYLSTSDEMLPIMISENVAFPTILGILGIKVFIGMAAGLLIDVIVCGKKEDHDHIHEMCEEENCHCEKGIWMSALIHTLHITLFILLINFLLELLLETIGEEVLAQMILNKPIVGPLLAGLVGMIPNCASSVIITRLFLEGALGLGAMMAGLLVNAGVGVLVLFRVNKNKKENIKILGLMYAIGVIAGMVLGFLPIQL
ncbi:MAG: arsenic efflux protein [Lachnospiraceae bacterium]|nr:arsenic efflux protein [Lachnospiraceae bacterium]